MEVPAVELIFLYDEAIKRRIGMNTTTKRAEITESHRRALRAVESALATDPKSARLRMIRDSQMHALNIAEVEQMNADDDECWVDDDKYWSN